VSQSTLTRAHVDAVLADLELDFKASAALAAPATAIEADDETGKVTAIVSVTGVRDEVNDIILPGAYAKTLAERNPKVCWHHDWKQPVGRVDHIEEWRPGDPRLPKQTKDGKAWPKDAGALVAAMTFNLKSRAGREAYEAVAFYSETGECEWSIGYQVPPGQATKDRAGTRHIKALDLFEVSFVLFGAAPLSMTLDFKAAISAWREVKSLQVGAEPSPRPCTTSPTARSTGRRSRPPPTCWRPPPSTGRPWPPSRTTARRSSARSARTSAATSPNAASPCPTGRTSSRPRLTCATRSAPTGGPPRQTGPR
jgi:hypothetical protein